MEQIELIKQIKRYFDFFLLTIIVSIYGFATLQRNFVWKDDFTLWSDVVKNSPSKARPHNNLGVAYTEKGLPEKAIAEIKGALRLKPNFINAYVSLGNAYTKIGLIDMAIIQYNEAIRLKPDYGEVYVNIGNAYINKGLIDQAIVFYKKGISLKPNYLPAHVNLASAYGLKGLIEETIIEYKKALEIESNNPDIHFNLGFAYEQLAKIYEQRAINKEQLAESRGLIVKAINEYEKTLSLNPDDVQARERMLRLMTKDNEI